MSLLKDFIIKAQDGGWNTTFWVLKRRRKNPKHDLMLDDTLLACMWNLSSTLYLRLKMCSKFFQLYWKLLGNMEIPPFFSMSSQIWNRYLVFIECLFNFCLTPSLCLLLFLGAVRSELWAAVLFFINTSPKYFSGPQTWWWTTLAPPSQQTNPRNGYMSL